VDWDAVFFPNTIDKFSVFTNMNPNVGSLRLFPGITEATVRAFLQAPMQGVVLETYGAGNAPDSRCPPFFPFFLNFIMNGHSLNCFLFSSNQN